MPTLQDLQPQMDPTLLFRKRPTFGMPDPTQTPLGHPGVTVPPTGMHLPAIAPAGTPMNGAGLSTYQQPQAFFTSPTMQAPPATGSPAPATDPGQTAPQAPDTAATAQAPASLPSLNIADLASGFNPSGILGTLGKIFGIGGGAGANGSNLLPFILPGLISMIVQQFNGRGSIDDATKALTQGGKDAISTIQGGQNQAAQGLSPYTTGGADAFQQYLKRLAPGGGLIDPFTPGDLSNEPGYQFRLSEGEKALRAQAAARGLAYSPATDKELSNYAGESASQEFQNAFTRNLQTEQLAQQGLLAPSQMGLSGAQSMASLQTGDARAIADIQTQISNAIASGDIAKANMLSSQLNALTSAYTQGLIINKLGGGGSGSGQGPGGLQLPKIPGLPGGSSGTPGDPGMPGTDAGDSGIPSDIPAGIPGGAGGAAGAGGIGAAGAGAAAAGAGAAGASLASIAAGAVPELGGTFGGAAIGGLTLPGTGLASPALAGGVAAPAGASSGFASALTGFLTNPWTIGIAAAGLGAYALIKHFQVHQTADEWVHGAQDKFDKSFGTMNDTLNQQIKAGTISKADAQTAENSMKDIFTQYKAQLDAFGKKGDKQRTVMNQAYKTLDQWYGRDGSKIFGGNDALIAGMAA